MSIENDVQTNDTPRRDDDLGTPPQSRVEQVLMNEQIKPQSRIEKLILEGGGGGGGTSDYNQLNHKPSINGETLSGNKTSSDLGLQAALTFDSVPTDGSTNPVESNGIYDALAGKQDTIDSSHKLSADLVDDASATNKFVTVADKASIGTSATKLTGISSSAASYIQLTNGLRLYVSSTEPTGNDIPEGSVWVGGTVT